MTQNELKNFFLSTGNWQEDRWGNLTKDTTNGKYRIKFNNKSLRYEKQVCHEKTMYSPASKSWVRLRSGYYGQLSITSENKLQGLK